MAKHLQLTGLSSFTHPLLRNFAPRLGQIVRTSDNDGAVLLAIQVRNDAGSLVSAFTEVSTGIAAHFNTVGYRSDDDVVIGLAYDAGRNRVVKPGMGDLPIAVYDRDQSALFVDDKKLFSIESTPIVQITATGTVKTGLCELAGFVVMASSSGTLTLYDGTSTSGRMVLPTTALTVGQRVEFAYQQILNSGLHAVIGGTATVNLLVSQ